MRWLAILLLGSLLGFGQSGPSTSTKAKDSNYCNQDLGFCFNYPLDWKQLGEVYEGRGVVVAPPQSGDQSEWAQVTVAAIDIPAQAGKTPPSVEDLVTALLGKMASQAENMQTIRRSEETLAGQPAQLVQVRYDENGHRWGETIVAMDGGNGTFYTVVFKALASEEAKYQKQVEGVLKSFRLAQ
jgi:hypothetical protein